MSVRAVFINCPFTDDYLPSFRAIVFTIIRCGFVPRCALETDDGSENRFDKICKIIGECRYGIHDISKTEPDPQSGLPRFNMPLELGLFLAAKQFGHAGQKQKRCLILDRTAYRYRQFISDLAGQDIHSHDDDPKKLIGKIASWLRDQRRDPRVPGGAAIAGEFGLFTSLIP